MIERPLIAARPAPPRPQRRWSWHHPHTRALVWQWLALLVVLLGLGWLIHNTQANMTARGIQSGWDFLRQTAGFDIGEQPITFASTDSYARAFAVGLLNTLRVSIAAIVLCTVLGLLVGLGRLSHNLPVRVLCRAYVELFRNVPLLVQLLLWYLLLVEYLPDPTEAWHWGQTIFWSKAGLSLPFPVHGAQGWHWSLPQLAGFALEGGAALSPEFLALLLGLTLYTAAFVAEVVRAGIIAVPRGQIEAALSIGLGQNQTLRYVIGPQALRVIVPPLTNQFLNLTKNSSLAVAIGYPDVVSIANTSLNQTGRALECIAILMVVYLALSLLTALAMGYLNQRAALRER